MFHKILRGLLIGLVSFIGVRIVSESRFFQWMELKSLDFKFFLRGFRAVDERVFLIGIDDPSIHILGRWPWPRTYHAALLESLSFSPPSAIGFDILFKEADEMNPDSDQALIAMSRLHDGLTYAAYLGADLQLPFEALTQSAHVGLINAPPDPDGAIRKIPLILKHKGRLYPSLALRLVMDYHSISEDEIEEVERGHKYFLRLRAKEEVLEIPVDERGNYQINFRSGLGNVNSGSFAQILKYKKDLRGKLCVVGLTATGVADFAPTPLDPHTPLVLVHVNVVQNILEKDFLRILPAFAEMTLGVLIVLLSGVVSFVAIKLWATVGSFLLLGLWGILNPLLFTQTNLSLSWVGPSLGILLTYIISTTIRYWVEESQKRYLRKAFQHYVSPGVLKRVLEDPKGLELGGKREELTVLFSDIRSFSTYCEKHAPEKVVMMLNEYLNGMTQIILDHGGTLDKYLGDGIMAIFGAPMRLQEDHAHVAVRVALEMQRALGTLRDQWVSRGIDPIEIGIGINTGPMVVGNMGSRYVMNYTVVGDEVNLASRLEALTRSFNASIIVSESTFQRVKGEWEGKFLGEVKVKGKETPVRVYGMGA